MAQFKISKGLKANLDNLPIIDGNCYYTIDESLFYIDFIDNNGILQRKSITGEFDYITEEDIDEICNSIPI